MIKSHCRLANFTSEWTCNKNLAHLFWQVTLLIKGTLHGLKSARKTIFPTWHLISSSPRLGKTSSHVQNLNHACLETAAEMHWGGGLVCWRLPASYRTQKWCVFFLLFFHPCTLRRWPCWSKLPRSTPGLEGHISEPHHERCQLSPCQAGEEQQAAALLPCRRAQPVQAQGLGPPSVLFWLHLGNTFCTPGAH